MIESLFQRTEFVAFTTQSKNDFRTLQRALIGELKLHDVAIRTCAIPLDSMRAPLPDSELRRMGFDGWAKDYLDGPEPVLAMLCSENRLNQTPVTAGDITDEVFDELQNLASVNSWVTRKHVYNVTRRREYGNASSTRARQVRAALFWTSQPVDTSLKQQYQQKIMSYEEEKAQLEQQEKSRRAELAELRKEKETLDREAVFTALHWWYLRPVTDLACRTRSRMKKSKNKLHRRSIKPYPRKFVRSFSSLANGQIERGCTDFSQSNKKPSSKTSNSFLPKSGKQSVRFVQSKTMRPFRKPRPLWNMR